MRVQSIHISGSGAAHGAGLFGFGRRPMLCAPVDGGGSGGDGGGGEGEGGVGERLYTQTEVNEMRARARGEGRRSANRGNGQQQRQQGGEGGGDRLSRLEGLVEGLVTAMRPPGQQQAEQPKPPTAPMPPGGKVPEMPTNFGLVDIYRLTPEQFAQLTPQQIVEHHKRAVEVARKQSGAVPLPAALRDRGGRR